MATLTGKRRRFVQEYLIDLNATAAYKRAGYTATGNAAEVGASRLLRLPEVQLAKRNAEAQRQDRTGITADRVLHALEGLAFPLPGAPAVSDAVRLRALELAGQHVGLFVNKVKLELEDVPPFRLIVDDGHD